MTPILECIKNKKAGLNPIWIMRQAGRYLPEFREIRAKNTDFVKLCLNENLSSEITLQPLKRFDFDAAIIFSDILMLPYGLKQKVELKKGTGPLLGDLNIDDVFEYSESEFIDRLQPVYNILKLVRQNKLLRHKNTIGFVGAPWTLLVYMVNKQSPKHNLNHDFFNDKSIIKKILSLLDKFLKIHIENQIKSGAEIIQIFDSWAGLLDEKDYEEYIFKPTFKLTEFTKNLGIPVICFPRGIKNYKIYCEKVKPSVISIDYNVDPNSVIKNIDIPIQGGLNPKFLLGDRETLKKEVLKYLTIFKDHPYIFNLGHGIQPETKIDAVRELVNIVKSF